MVEFVLLVESDDTFLPFITPSGYKIRLNGSDGNWSENAGSPDLFVESGIGSDTLTVNGFPRGRILCRENYVDAHGRLTGQGDPFDPLVLHTVTAPCILGFFENVASGSLVTGWVLADLTLYGDTFAVPWSHSFDFTSINGGFVPEIDGSSNPRAQWLGGTGWENGPTFNLDECTIAFHLLHDTNIDAGSITFNTVGPTSAGFEVGVEDAQNGTTQSPALRPFFTASVTDGDHPVSLTNANAVVAGHWLFISIGDAVGTIGACKILNASFSGTGTDPFV
jgi:hypothetical protein